MKLTKKQARSHLSDIESDIREFCYMAGIDEDVREEYMQALQMGEDALEKQIPKKPREDTFGWYCPICNHYFDPRAWKSAYCGRCGNKLDWESDN